VNPRTQRVAPATARWAILALVILALGVVAYFRTVADAFGNQWGYDFLNYVDATRRWMDTGTPYLPSEVAAPFDYGPLTRPRPTGATATRTGFPPAGAVQEGQPGVAGELVVHVAADSLTFTLPRRWKRRKPPDSLIWSKTGSTMTLRTQSRTDGGITIRVQR
jgi:hypothetical protein